MNVDNKNQTTLTVFINGAWILLLSAWIMLLEWAVPAACEPNTCSTSMANSWLRISPLSTSEFYVITMAFIFSLGALCLNYILLIFRKIYRVSLLLIGVGATLQVLILSFLEEAFNSSWVGFAIGLALVIFFSLMFLFNLKKISEDDNNRTDSFSKALSLFVVLIPATVAMSILLLAL